MLCIQPFLWLVSPDRGGMLTTIPTALGPPHLEAELFINRCFSMQPIRLIFHAIHQEKDQIALLSCHDYFTTGYRDGDERRLNAVGLVLPSKVQTCDNSLNKSVKMFKQPP